MAKHKQENKKEEKKEVKKTICKKCNSSYTYVLIDGTVVCRNCSHREPLKD